MTKKRRTRTRRRCWSRHGATAAAAAVCRRTPTSSALAGLPFSQLGSLAGEASRPRRGNGVVVMVLSAAANDTHLLRFPYRLQTSRGRCRGSPQSQLLHQTRRPAHFHRLLRPSLRRRRRLWQRWDSSVQLLPATRHCRGSDGSCPLYAPMTKKKKNGCF